MTKRKTGESSSSLVLLCHAPQTIAFAYRRAQSGIGDARERLRWRLGFVELLQRFFTGILAMECVGLALPLPNAYKTLLNKLQTPSMGDWGRASSELAQELLKSEGEPVFQELPALYWEVQGVKWVETPFARHLKDLVELRNHLFHRDGAPGPDEGDAKRRLKETESPLRDICHAIRILKRYPVLYLVPAQKSGFGVVKANKASRKREDFLQPRGVTRNLAAKFP